MSGPSTGSMKGPCPPIWAYRCNTANFKARMRIMAITGRRRSIWSTMSAIFEIAS